MRFKLMSVNNKVKVVFLPCNDLEELENRIKESYGDKFVWLKAFNTLFLENGINIQVEQTKNISLIPKNDTDTEFSVFENENSMYVQLQRGVAIPLEYLNLDNFYILDGDKEISKKELTEYANKIR